VNGQGTDYTTCRIRLPAGVDRSRSTVLATLYYQSIPPYYLNDQFREASQRLCHATLCYLASHLKLQGTPAEDCKLKIASTRATTTPGPSR